jgi:hypothetical protein
MPRPQYERIASSHDYGIYLPIKSVESFFDEYKKEVRQDIKDGHFPPDFVRAHCPCPLRRAQLDEPASRTTRSRLAAAASGHCAAAAQ